MDNIDSSATELNNSLAKTNHPVAQAQQVIFCRKVNEDSHSPLNFNNNIVYQATSEWHLGIILVNHLAFEEHLRPVLVKINETIQSFS